MSDEYDKFVGSFNMDIEENVANAFKRVFSGDDGQYVMGIILERCKFMDYCDNERDMALNNFAKELLAYIFYDPRKKGANIHRIIEFVRENFKRSKQ